MSIIDALSAPSPITFRPIILPSRAITVRDAPAPILEQPFRRMGAASAPPPDLGRRREGPPPVSAGLLARNDLTRHPIGRAATAPPPSASERARFDQYASLIRARGGEVNPGGRASVLGIRRQDGVTRRFEDKLVVLTPDHRVREFEASTRPSNTTARNGGVAELKPGNYTVVPHGDHYGQPSWEVQNRGGSNRVPVYRDLNGDGAYSEAEKRNPRTGAGILFHIPSPKTLDQSPTSIGCINVRARDWAAFGAAVGGRARSFAFTLIGP